MNELTGKVALVTGAARGQGRSHAVRFAREGADVTVLDLAAPVATVGYDMPNSDDLMETGALIEREGRKALVKRADVRDQEALAAAVNDTIAEFGRLDVVVANAGIAPLYGPSWELSQEQWQDVIDINLTGVWQTIKASVPAMIAAGNGGSIVVISSTAGTHAYPGIAHYSAAKHGLVGLMRSVAQEVAEFSIRVNSVHPGGVDTQMMMNERLYRTMRPDLENPGKADIAEAIGQLTLLPVPWVEVEDVTNAVLWLASDASRYVTGVVLPVDGGRHLS